MGCTRDHGQNSSLGEKGCLCIEKQEGKGSNRCFKDDRRQDLEASPTALAGTLAIPYITDDTEMEIAREGAVKKRIYSLTLRIRILILKTKQLHFSCEVKFNFKASQFHLTSVWKEIKFLSFGGEL